MVVIWCLPFCPCSDGADRPSERTAAITPEVTVERKCKALSGFNSQSQRVLHSSRHPAHPRSAQNEGPNPRLPCREAHRQQVQPSSSRSWWGVRPSRVVWRPSEDDRRPDSARHERVRKARREPVHRLPPSAVRRHEQAGRELVEGSHCRLDDGLEHRPAEVEPTDDGGVCSSPEPLHVSDDVDDARVASAGEHDETVVGEPEQCATTP